LNRAKQLLQMHVAPEFKSKLVNNPEYKSWKSAASAFFTKVNENIETAKTSELSLLSSDEKLFVAVQSAPSNYSSNLALLLCFSAKENQVDDVFTVAATNLLFCLGTKRTKCYQYTVGVAGGHKAYVQDSLDNPAICCMSPPSSQTC